MLGRGTPWAMLHPSPGATVRVVRTRHMSDSAPSGFKADGIMSIKKGSGSGLRAPFKIAYTIICESRVRNPGFDIKTVEKHGHTDVEAERNPAGTLIS